MTPQADASTEQDPTQIFGDFYAVLKADGDRVLAMLELRAGSRVLDVGTGAGTFATFLAKAGFDVTTGEPSSDQTHYARQEWAENTKRVGIRDCLNFVDFSAGDMPFKDGDFAAVFFYGVLHHVDEAERTGAMAEAVRVCQTDGAVVFFEPKRSSLEAIRARDPAHPDLANPPDYLNREGVRWTELSGDAMDIFVLTSAVGDDRPPILNKRDLERTGSMSVAELHEQQNAIWNGQMGENWVETQRLTDEMLAPAEACLVAEVEARKPKHVLDIGCGNGGTTAAMAKALGEGGTVTGIDLSYPMIENARRLRTGLGDRLAFAAGDAAQYDFVDRRFDHFTSRFGTMFFADQAAAFARLRRFATDDATLYLIVWRGPEENPFLTTGPRVAASILGPGPQSDPDAPSPFAMSEPEKVRGMLEASGWHNIDMRSLDLQFSFAASEIDRFITKLAPLGTAVTEADDDVRAKVYDQVRAEYQAAIQDGWLSYSAACWAISGTAI
ncbi:MAG: methyltransferase domain-containing protein [Pseudomonadota bacterium]